MIGFKKHRIVCTDCGMRQRCEQLGSLMGTGVSLVTGPSVFSVAVGVRFHMECVCWPRVVAGSGEAGGGSILSRAWNNRLLQEPLPALRVDACLLSCFGGERVLLLTGLPTGLCSPLAHFGRQVFPSRTDVKTKTAPPHTPRFCPSCLAHGHTEVDPRFSCRGGVLTSKHILHLFPSQLNSIRLEGQNVEEGKTV